MGSFISIFVIEAGNIHPKNRKDTQREYFDRIMDNRIIRKEIIP